MDHEQTELIDDAGADAILDELEREAGEEAPAHPASSRATRALGVIFRVREITVLGAAVLLFLSLSLATPLFLQLDNLLLVARQLDVRSNFGIKPGMV